MKTEDALRFKIQELQEINTALGRENLLLMEQVGSMEEMNNTIRGDYKKYFRKCKELQQELERYKKYMQGEDRRPYIEWTRGKLIDELERYRDFKQKLKAKLNHYETFVWNPSTNLLDMLKEFEGDNTEAEQQQAEAEGDYERMMMEQEQEEFEGDK